MEFNDRLLAALRSERSRPLFAYAGTEYNRGEIADFAERVVSLLDAAQVPLDAKVGVVVRNRVLHAAAMLGLIGHGRPLTTKIGRASCRGKSVSVRVDLGGSRIIKHKHQSNRETVRWSTTNNKKSIG